MGWQPRYGHGRVYQYQDHKRRARATSRRNRWHRTLRSIKLWLPIPLIVVLGALAIAANPWPALVSLRHFAAAPNCDAARAVGLAPARRGQPGYYPKHDRDQDGIACEPWPR